MQNLIKNDAVTEDAWRLIRADDESYDAAEDVILPLAAWLALDPAAAGAGAVAADRHRLPGVYRWPRL